MTPSEEGNWPIALSADQELLVKQWAADDRLWTTPETVEFNLRVFMRCVLKPLLARVAELEQGRAAAAQDYDDIETERDRLKEDKQDLTCEIAECHGELDCRAKDIQRLEGELVKRGDLLDEVLKDAVDAQKRLEAELAEARNKLDLTAMAMFCGTDMPDGHRWVRDAHDETLTCIHFCQWCGVHKVEVPDWLDNPQCPTMAALLRHAPAKEGE